MLRLRQITEKLARLVRYPIIQDGASGLPRGMSLIEIIIVMSLVGGLMVLMIGQIQRSSAAAKVKETELAFGQLRSAMQLYRMATNKYPTTEQGLKSLLEKPQEAKGWRGPYCEPELLKDAWGGDIQFESDGRQMKFRSPGDDGQIGNDDDVVWPAEEKANP